MAEITAPVFLASASELPDGVRRVDGFESAMRELYFVDHPDVAREEHSAADVSQYIKSSGVNSIWVCYPWRNLAVRIPPEDIYFRLRTARNRDLITEAEQKKYRDSTVGIAGLSVGSSVVSSLVRTGGPKTLKLADPDTVEITNLNRMNAKLSDAGSNKADVAAAEIWEIDPFADVHIWREGVRSDTLEEFIAGAPRLDVFVDEMDDIPLKFAGRLLCQKYGIPVVMATDNGDGAIIDIERFDIEPNRPIFHGNVDPSVAQTAKTRQDFVAASSAIIGSAYFTERQVISLQNIGKTLSGVAQIGSAAAIAGAAISYVVRQIVIGSDMPSGKYVLSCEQAFCVNGEVSRKEIKR